MTSTRAGLPVSIDELAVNILELILQPREVILKHERPKSKHVADLIRKVRCGRATPMHMICRLSFTDVEDTRIPIGSVTRPFEVLITMLQHRRREIETHGVNAPSLLPIMLRESRAEAALNDAQLRATANPNDPEALEELLAKSAAYDAVRVQMDAAARERLASLRRQRGETTT